MILGAILCSMLAFSQCTINGKSSIKILDEETYDVAPEAAQCKECHLWTSIGNNTSIIGGNKLSSIKIKANSAGNQVISLSILTQQGLVQCSKNINILNNEEMGTPKNSYSVQPSNTNVTPCDIDINNYKEVKYSENTVSLFPSNIDNNYKYQWTVTYENGEQMKSTEKVAQFPFTKERSITSIKLQIVSKKCIKGLSKTYGTDYWKLF